MIQYRGVHTPRSPFVCSWSSRLNRLLIHQLGQRRFGRGAGARPNEEEHRLPGPALGGMILQEAGALGGRQSDLRGSQDKGVRLTAKNNGGVGRVGSAEASPSRRISPCRRISALGQTVHLVA